MDSLRGIIQAHDAGLLTLKQIQALSIDHAKELRKATDAPDLPATEATMKQIKKLLDMRIDPPPMRLVPRDDHGRKWTIRESEGQVFTHLNTGDRYSIQLHTGEKYEGEFKTTLDRT
jgi:hypothetical protein